MVYNISKHAIYVQCRLRNRYSYMVSWIPINLAKSGNRLVIKDESGWVVEEVFKTKKREDELKKISDQYRNTRKESDI